MTLIKNKTHNHLPKNQATLYLDNNSSQLNPIKQKENSTKTQTDQTKPNNPPQHETMLTYAKNSDKKHNNSANQMKRTIIH